MPNNGWVPVDPYYCDALCPDGSIPLYFGTIPELDQRVALTYGFDHVVSGHSISMLQSPAVFISGSTKVGSIQTYCNLGTTNSN